MDERRKHKRLDLDVSVQLERLDQDDITTLKFIHVVVTDISRSGIGFVSDQNLKVGTYYDTKIQIWTKEVIDRIPLSVHTISFILICNQLIHVF